ncbi:MAG: hypothetical protein RMM08_06455 [Armatimonadota bacterium]|nr:hypothetical protein [Armatimonadota bacterium]
MKQALLLLLLLYAPLASATAQPRAFLDLSPASVADAIPTPHPASQPVSSLQVAPGGLVRVTVGFRFEPSGDIARWYLLSALLSLNHPDIEVVTPNPSNIAENAFWHPHVAERGSRAQAIAAVSPQTAPMRANMLHPNDANSPIFSSSGALWVVLAPAGNAAAGAWYIGHVYLRVKENTPDNTVVTLALAHLNDPTRTLPNSLLATDGARRYHLFGEHLPADTAALHVKASRVQVVAQITLEDYLGSPQGRQMEVQIRQPGSTEPLETHHSTLDENGILRITTALNGVYDFSVKGEHWLRRTAANVNLSGTVNLSLSLQNGDIDGDNEVSLFDFGLLVAAFGAVPEHTNWNPLADLDGDEEVSLFDFGILVRNFGAIGDE